MNKWSVFSRCSPLACAIGLLSLLPAVASLFVLGQADATQHASAEALKKSVRNLEHYDRILREVHALDAWGAEALQSPAQAVASQDLASVDRRFQEALAAARAAVDSPGPAQEEHLRRMARLDASRQRMVQAIGMGLVPSGRDGEQTAELHRASGDVVQILTQMRRAERASQLSVLEAAAADLRRDEHYKLLLLTLFGATVCGLVLLGQRSAQTRTAAEQARDHLLSLQRRNAALEEAIEGIATFDAHGCYNWVNGKFAGILGYAPAELEGRDIRAALVNVDRQTLVDGELELRATGRTEQMVSVSRKDGSVAHVHVVLVNRGGNGFVFLTDLTKEKQTEAALRLSEERFSLAMLATRDAISDWDILNNRTWVNDALYTEFGDTKRGETYLEQWLDAIHPSDQERVLVSRNEAFADTETDCFTSEYRLRRDDGTFAHVFDRTYILRGEEGLPLRLVSALTDMTARREAEIELERLSVQNRMILGSVADGLYGIDAQGLTTFANRASQDLLGWTEEELCGRSLHEVIHCQASGGEPVSWEHCAIRATVVLGEAASGRTTFWTRSGKEIHVEFTSNPMRDAARRIVGAVITFRDITDRLAMERMKDEFISIVSHELRTPLTAIRGALGLIAAGRAGELPPKINRMLEIAVSNTDRLIRLINDILDIERMDSGTIALSRRLCEAEELIRDAIESIRPLADQASVHIEQGPSTGVLFADRDRLQQTLTNLVGNAIKFSPPGTTVTVSACVEGRFVRFAVQDQGRGIPAEKIHTIFERFEQVDASDSRQKGGSGLGLAISRSIVRQHGGEIWAEPLPPGEGSRFIFTLPRVQRAAPPLAKAASRMILVCDDDDIVREVEIELLESAGYAAKGFASGTALLESEGIGAADLVLLDIGLPDMDGRQVLAALKARLDTAHVPVIVLSGSEFVGPDEGAVASLRKPLDESELLSIVASAIREGAHKPRVLLGEGDLDLAGVMVESFERIGLQTCHAATGREAIQLAHEVDPELIVLEVALPEIDGFGVIEILRRHPRLSRVPLVVYSAIELTLTERDQLRLGPTEFLTKSRVSPEQFELHIIGLLDSMEMSHVA